MKLFTKTFLLFLLFIPAVTLAQKNGLVQEFTPDGAVIENNYKKGVLEGKSKTYYKGSENVHIEGSYKKGKKEGVWKFYKYPEGEGKYTYQWFTYENDTLNGPYMQMDDGVITEGNYKGGELSGSHSKNKIQVSDGGDTLYIPIEKGQYLAGKIDGEWKYYENGVLASEGKYVGQKKGFTWKEYGLHSKPHEVMREVRYKDGQKDGRVTEYFHYECVDKDCPEPDKNNCCKYKKVDVYKEIIYYKGELYGKYVAKEKNADGKVLEKGEYVEGEKVGEWYELGEGGNTIVANYFNGKRAGPITIKNAAGKVITTGSYNNGIKNGEWVYFDQNGAKLHSANYDNGVLNGDAWIFENGKKAAQAKIEKGKMYLYVKLAENGDALEEFELEYGVPEKEWVHVQHMFSVNDTVFYYNYHFKPVTPINYETWEEDFANWKQKGVDFHKNGSYEKIYNDVTLVYGEYTKNLKDGVWEYDYRNNALWRQNYSLGKLQSEEFFTADKQPLDDDYVVNYKNGNPKFEFKIKDGKRHGKSRYYDKNGNEIKEEKYKEGIKD